MTKDELEVWHRAPATQEVLRALEAGFPLSYRQCREWDDKRFLDGKHDVLQAISDPERLWSYLNAQ